MNALDGEYGSIKITVRDNGVGIKQNDIPKLFKLFGFLDSTQELNTQGIGLGLYICKKIAQTFDGDTAVKSEIDKGSDFSFNFKLSDKHSNNESIGRLLNPQSREVLPVIAICAVSIS